MPISTIICLLAAEEYIHRRAPVNISNAFIKSASNKSLASKYIKRFYQVWIKQIRLFNALVHLKETQEVQISTSICL